MIDMACKRALELILDAEPAELSLDGDTALVGHLTNCARCRAVAKRLAERTQAIARKIEAEPAFVATIPASPEIVVRRRSVAPYIGLAAAAGLAVVMLREPRSRIPEPSLGMGDGGGVVTPRVTAVAPSPPPRAALRRIATAERIRAIPVTPARFQTPSAEAAVRQIRETRNTESSGVISVAPPAGVRATVMATSNPAVTVVWLQAADTTRSPR